METFLVNNSMFFLIIELKKCCFQTINDAAVFSYQLSEEEEKKNSKCTQRARSPSDLERGVRY